MLPFFDDPDHPRLPPDQVRILDLQADPYPDGRRLLVRLETSPFERSPHLEVALNGPDGGEVTSATFIEPLSWKLEFTLHLREAQAAGRYTLTARLFYPEGPQAEPVSLALDLSPTA